MHPWSRTLLHVVSAAAAVMSVGCDPRPDAVYIRVYNNSDFDLDSVRFGMGTFGHVASASFSAYQSVSEAYRYGAATAKIGDKWVRVWVIDYVGETPLENGRYTYMLSADPEGDDIDQRLLASDDLPLPKGLQPADKSKRRTSVPWYEAVSSTLHQSGDVIVAGSRAFYTSINPTISLKADTRVIYLPDARVHRATYTALLARVDVTSGATTWERAVGTEDIGPATFLAVEGSDAGVLGAGMIETYEMHSGGPRNWRTEAWLSQADASGNALWTKSLDHEVASIGRLGDGGFALAGTRNYTEPTITVLAPDGTQRWSRGYPNLPRGESLTPMADGGLVVVGDRFGSLSQQNAGWAMRTDSAGEPLWTLRFNGSAVAVARTPDNGVVIGGKRPNNEGRVIRVAADGKMVWDKTFMPWGEIKALIALPDGIAAAGSSSTGFRFVRADYDGNVIVERTYTDVLGSANGIHRLPDGDFILTGTGDYRMRVLRVGPTGELRWYKNVGQN